MADGVVGCGRIAPPEADLSLAPGALGATKLGRDWRTTVTLPPALVDPPGTTTWDG